MGRNMDVNMVGGNYPVSVHVGLQENAFFTIEHEKKDGTIIELTKVTPEGGLSVNGRDILKEIDDLKKENQDLKDKMDKMDAIITQLYYNPPNQGGPGYELAKTDFLSRQQSTM